MIIGRQLVEDQYEEKLYSTGNDELDEMLEKAFCEGYEYAQKEFATPLKPGMAMKVMPKIPQKAVSVASANPTSNGVFHLDRIQKYKQGMARNNIPTTSSNMKQILGREMQEVRQTGPVNFNKTPKKFTKGDIRLMNKYFPKNI